MFVEDGIDFSFHPRAPNPTGCTKEHEYIIFYQKKKNRT